MDQIMEHWKQFTTSNKRKMLTSGNGSIYNTLGSNTPLFCLSHAMKSLFSL